MKTFALLAVLAQAWTSVEATNCRASSCNAGIAKAVRCDTNKPRQCASVIGCQYFYSTIVYKGCATTTITVYDPQKTVTATRVAQKTVTTTKQGQPVDQTTVNTIRTTDTILTEISSDTTVIATETATVVTTVATETSTDTLITGTATIRETETDSTTTTAFTTTSVAPEVGPAYPGNRRRSTPEGTLITSPGGKSFLVPPGEDVSKYEATLEEELSITRRGLDSYPIHYPQGYQPAAVKSCLNPRSYSAACNCFGAHAKTITKPTSIKTVKVTRSKSAVTVTVPNTNTVTATATQPGATNRVTQTTTVVEFATASVTETESITQTLTETDSTTAEETTTLETDTATTTTDTATQTTTISSVATATANPFIPGGSCGCRQPFIRGTRINVQGVFYKTGVFPTFLECGKFCDDSFGCKGLDYNIGTGDCRLSNRANVGTIEDADYYYGPQPVFPPGSNTCAGVCTSP